MELIRHIYPKFSMTPGLLLAPGWTQKPNVGIALAAKCEEINGVFTCECILDIDTAEAPSTQTAMTGKNKERIHQQARSTSLAAGKGRNEAVCIFRYLRSIDSVHDASNDDVPNPLPFQ